MNRLASIEMERSIQILILSFCLVSISFAQSTSDSIRDGLERLIIEDDDGSIDTVWVDNWSPNWIKSMDSLTYLDSMFNSAMVSFDTSEVRVEWKKTHHFLGLTATLPDSVDHKVRIMAFNFDMYDKNGELTSTLSGHGNRLSLFMKKELMNAHKGDWVKFNKFYLQCDGHVFSLNRNVVVMIE